MKDFIIPSIATFGQPTPIAGESPAGHETCRLSRLKKPSSATPMLRRDRADA
jgi:hypothetical protein